MRKGYARQVRTVSQDGRLSLFQVERPPLPASHQATPVYSPSACDEIASFYLSSSRYLQTLNVGGNPRGLISEVRFVPGADIYAFIFYPRHDSENAEMNEDSEQAD